MITFTDRENSIRTYLNILKENGETDSSIANQFGLAVRTIREFMGYTDKQGNLKQRKLSTENYNIIVNKLRTLPITVQKIDFEKLVILLRDTSDIKWDFPSTFDNEEDFKKIEECRDFITKNAMIKKFPGASLLDIINLSDLKNESDQSIPQDSFMRYRNLKLAKEVYDKKFNDIFIWGASYYSFLYSGDEKEVFIFVSFQKDHESMSEITLTNKTKGIFTPKQKQS